MDTYRLFKRGEQMALCKVVAKGIGSRLIHALRMQTHRKAIILAGKRHGVSVWQLPKRDEHPSLI